MTDVTTKFEIGQDVWTIIAGPAQNEWIVDGPWRVSLIEITLTQLACEREPHARIWYFSGSGPMSPESLLFGSEADAVVAALASARRP